MTSQARRPITRTYEGVQWFKMDNGNAWIASVPGTSLGVIRYPKNNAGRMNAAVYRFDGEEWNFCQRIGRLPLLYRGQALPWNEVHSSSVRVISQHVQALRSCFSGEVSE